MMLIQTREQKCKCVLCGKKTIRLREYSCKGFTVSHGMCFECEDNHDFFDCGVFEPLVAVMRELIKGRKRKL